jgi:quercetin dioxygenase-like cupin family protein
MRQSTRGYIVVAIALSTLAFSAQAERNGAGIQGLLDQTIEKSQLGPQQEMRVFTSVLAPGAKLARSYHPGIETFYVLQGAITVEFAGEPPKTVKAGEAMVEPPYLAHTAYNPNPTDSTKLLNIYVSNPGAPFLVSVP